MPHKSSVGKRIVAIILVVALIVGGLAAAAAVLWNSYGTSILGWFTPAEQTDYDGEGHGEVLISIRDGDIGADVAETLAAADVVKTSAAFYELLLTQHPAVEFHAGTYRMKLQMSAQAALDAIEDPANRLDRTVIIPEGLTAWETLRRTAEVLELPMQDFEAAIADPARFGVPAEFSTLEGYLFPATYTFEPNDTVDTVVQRMVDRMKEALAEQGVAAEDELRVLTIASIVQREAGRVEDFGRVSRVIANRLETGMKLEMDSTAQYGMGQHSDGSVWSTDEALRDDNPWNTYVITGLPVGPIASPGSEAISAALTPPPGNWIYFAAVNLDTRETLFSETLDEHEQVVEQLRDWCDANPGRGC